MGGQNDSGQFYKTVELYRLDANIWEDFPDLVTERSRASSCCHGSYVYVFCGLSTNGSINTVERVAVEALQPGRTSDARWELIKPYPREISRRYQPIVAPLNDTQIVILGGNDNKNDAVLYDPAANTWETVIANNPDEQGYCGTSNMSACVDEDHVVFLAATNAESDQVKLMEYRNR